LNIRRRVLPLVLALGIATVAGGILIAQNLAAQESQEEFKPIEGQAGRDVVWVPTPFTTVEKMLDMAKVTAKDYVIDLGSGDGRNVIAAAKRGATAVGFEFNPKMVALSRQLAAKAGVSDKATFVEGDMYEADISKATVMAMFLLTENLNKLAPKFVNLRPGTRIVINGFGIDGWTPDETERANDCGSWCTVHLFYVPAKVDGTWSTPQGDLTIRQSFQKFTGTLASSGKQLEIKDGLLRGDQISFTADGTKYAGTVNGSEIVGTAPSAWKATKK
jgi:SAM-dependent methyltransferase